MRLAAVREETKNSSSAHTMTHASVRSDVVSVFLLTAASMACMRLAAVKETKNAAHTMTHASVQ